tara:strand:- start:8968 stop:9162 length:195 start_codon:yes stop_codon:yes gene_type:complete
MNAYVMQALSAQRRAHLANVALIEATIPDLEPNAAARAHRTRANLQRQIGQIDAQMLRNNQRAA